MSANFSSRRIRSRFSDVAAVYAGRHAAWGKLQGRIRSWLAEDLATRAIWAPVAVGFGVAVYFGLAKEPPAALVLSALLCALLAIAIRDNWRSVAIPILLVVLGFAAADWRTQSVAAPILKRETGIRSVAGEVIAVERRMVGERVTIKVTSIDRFETEDLPARARITWRGKPSDVNAGDQITFLASLGPPPPPAAPGGYDFARQLYFQRIGAVGFAVSPPASEGRLSVRSLAARIEIFRTSLFRRITSAAPGKGGAIIAAIVTGKREAITEESRANLRDAGLAHLLAISGLHMGLATGIVFFCVRAGLAMIEPVAVRYPIKKWAALAAILAGAFYLTLSGGSWSSRRAFIMTTIILSAILFDRRALSLRNVAIAACVILLTTPEAVVHPGFQMSFAAAAALIAVYEWWNSHADPAREFSLFAKFRRYAAGLIVTDLVAALATAPFALYHFNRVALFSLPANVIAMPLMAFWIMPFAVLGLLLAPLGLDAFAWRASAAGMDVVLTISNEVSSWPGAVAYTPNWPVAALIAATGGGLWLVLARSPLRYFGLLGAPICALFVASAHPPDLFVAASGGNAGIVIENEGAPDIAAYSGRRDKFSVGVWKEMIGGDPDADVHERLSDYAQCDSDGCVAIVKGQRISIIERPEDLAEDCARAELVIALFPVSGKDWRACQAILIDKRSVWRRGAHAFWLDDEKIRIKTASDLRGERPWSRN